MLSYKKGKKCIVSIKPNVIYATINSQFGGKLPKEHFLIISKDRRVEAPHVSRVRGRERVPRPAPLPTVLSPPGWRAKGSLVGWLSSLEDGGRMSRGAPLPATVPQGGQEACPGIQRPAVRDPNPPWHTQCDATNGSPPLG